MEVYPNPAKDQLHVRLSGDMAANAHVQILDITGRVVKTVVANSSMLGVDITALPAGVYIVKYHDDIRNQAQKITKH